MPLKAMSELPFLQSPPQFPAPRMVFPEGPELPADEAEDGDASVEDIACREAAAQEDLRCFISFAGPEDGVLGLGLYCHAWTRQQQRANLPPDFDIVGDYVDAEAFNEGTRCAVRAACNRHASSREPPSFVSSLRRRINSWMPLYISAQHWARARRYVPSAIAQLALRYYDSTYDFCIPQHNEQYATDLHPWFHPADALDVCCGLLTSAAVSFTRPDSEWGSPHGVAKSKASERSLQMFADVHRLLLQLAEEHSGVRCLARDRLQQFIADPANRTQEVTPSLGNLAHCLLIVEEVSWEELARCLLPEALRRHIARQRCRGFHFHIHNCSGSTRKLIDEWDNFAPQAGLVTCFCLVFCQRVGRPQGCNLRDVAQAYDRRWGRLETDVMADIMCTCARLLECKSLVQTLEMVFPQIFRRDNVDFVGEMILWAELHGRRMNTGPIRHELWPQWERDSCHLLQKWRTSSSKRGKKQQQWTRHSSQVSGKWGHSQAYCWVPTAAVHTYQPYAAL